MKPRSKRNSTPSFSAASPTQTPVKRTLDLDGGGGAAEEGKKSVPMQRLFSEDDEVVVLNGFLEYKELKGVDPLVDAAGFYHFIMKSLHLKVDQRQVTDKIRKLKRRYETNRSYYKNKHQNAFDLSKKIWGNDVEGAELDPQSYIKPGRFSKGEADNEEKQVDPQSNIKTRRFSNGEDDKEKKRVESNDSEMNKEAISLQFVGQSSILMGLDPNIVKVGLELCSDVKKIEMEEKWKQFYFEESSLFLRKIDLAREESNMIMEALKSDEGK